MKTREKHTGMLLAAAALATAFTCTAFTVSAAEEQEMRTVETDKGEVEIPVNPEKIVSDYYLGEFLERYKRRNLSGNDRGRTARSDRHHYRG